MDDDLRHRVIGFFTRRSSDYNITFSRTNSSAQRVLADIQDFACGVKTTAGGDRDQMLIREGRRQVFLRIVRALNLSAEEQFNLATNKDQP